MAAVAAENTTYLFFDSSSCFNILFWSVRPSVAQRAHLRLLLPLLRILGPPIKGTTQTQNRAFHNSRHPQETLMEAKRDAGLPQGGGGGGEAAESEHRLQLLIDDFLTVRKNGKYAYVVLRKAMCCPPCCCSH